MTKLKIGYSSQVPDLSHPADRRRLVYWANQRGHEIIQDLTSTVDVIVLSGRSDFSKVEKYQETAPVIIDLVDGYLENENPIIDFARGLGKLGVGQISGNPRRFSVVLSDAISLADATICASIEQQVPIEKFTKNSYAILDFHEEFPFIPFANKSYQHQLLWEGQAFTVGGLLSLHSVFSGVLEDIPIALNVVTDLEVPRILGQFGKKNTMERVGKLPQLFGKDFRLTPWSLPNVIASARDSIISIIPLAPGNVLNPLKPENRLLIMWRLGLPCLTSPTLAYNRVMQEVGIDGVCDNASDWRQKLEELIEVPAIRREVVEKGQAYVREKHNVIDTLNRWDEAIESVL